MENPLFHPHIYYCKRGDSVLGILFLFQKFLPKFEKDDQVEKIKTLKILLGGGNMKFGNPIDNFKKRLLEGQYNPDNVKMNEVLKKIDLRHCR